MLPSFDEKGFKIIHLNIRSLWKNQHELFVHFKGFDIIALSETWLHPNISDILISEPGYSILRQDRMECHTEQVKSRGGGLLLYIKDCYAEYVTKIEIQHPLSKNFEQMWFSINIPYRRKILMGLCYRPPAGKVPAALHTLNVTMDLLDISNYKDLLIVGDFNINYRDRSSVGFKELKELERKFLIQQKITTPTRICFKSKSTIDLVFTNIEHVHSAGTYNISISDHLPTYLILKKCRQKKHSITTKSRKYKNYKTDVFQHDIKSHFLWKTFWSANDVDTQWETLLSIINSVLDDCCPVGNIQINSNGNEWLTNEVIEAIHEKNRLYRKACKSSSEQNWDQYKISRKYARNLLLNTKEAVLKTQLNENFSNPKRFWQRLNDIIGNTKQSKTFTSIQNDLGEKIENQDAADYMNEYFSNIGESLNANNSFTWQPHSYFDEGLSNKFSLNVVTESIVQKYIKDIDISKPSGIPYLNNKVLRDALLCIPFELTSIFNNSILDEYFPSQWKNGIITPIPKPGKLTVKSNWRPISILNTVGKILEKVVHYQTSLYLQYNEILNDNQHGFRRNFSTSSAIHEFLIDIYDCIRKKEIMGCVYIDYQKEFDTINHKILFSKLKLYGFSENCVNWFRSYLTGRTQCTKFNVNYISSPKDVSLGVPQGSTLGPLLFIIYVNDICHISNIYDVKIKMYADDTVIYTSGTRMSEVQRVLQDCSNYVNNWCIMNRLYMNMKTTKTMWFGTNSDNENVEYENINISGNTIERVCSYHYLGVELDSNLTFDKHLDNVVSKCNQKLYIFRKIRRFISESTALLVYKQTIRPLVEYCSFIFNTGKKAKIDKIDKVQSKCICIIENCNNKMMKKDEDILCKEYNLTSLQQRRDVQLGCIMYKYSRNALYVDNSVNRENLRSEGKIKFNCPFTRKSKIRSSPFYRGVDLWNSLRVEHHRAENKKRFKNLLLPTLD